MVRAVAAVSNVGTENAAVFNFTIPRGEKGDKGSFLFGYTTVSVDNKEIHTRAISYTHTPTDTWANADHAHNDDAIYTAIQSLFVYDETTKTLNIIPYGGGS